MRKGLLCLALLIGSGTAGAVPVFSENFDSFAAIEAGDWLFGNFSNLPVNGQDWFQGNAGVFSSRAGAPDSYAAANIEAAEFGSNVDVWMVTPRISATSATNVSFYTRTAAPLFPGDTLELLYNTSNSFNPVDYVSMGSIGAFSTDWTPYIFGFAGSATNVRFAFRYTVSDTSQFGNYIGIDSLVVDGQSAAVPEPATALLLGAGLLLMPLAMRRRRLRH